MTQENKSVNTQTSNTTPPVSTVPPLSTIPPLSNWRGAGGENLQEQAEFLAWKAEKQKSLRRDQERQAYKQLVDEAVTDLFPELQKQSLNLSATKQKVYDRLSDAIKIKEDIFSIREDQSSHTFTTSNGNFRIILGTYLRDDYDDTVEEGIAKVKQYIQSLAIDRDSGMLVTAILKLMSRDQKGSLKASRVMQLRKMAIESASPDFIDGVDIIEKAYRPATSKQFVRAEFKNDIGAWINIPLGMTEA
jgi:hypothetical protein